jgi:hypothetical protein
MHIKREKLVVVMFLREAYPLDKNIALPHILIADCDTGISNLKMGRFI